MSEIGHELFDYEGMYTNAEELCWRELCARDKVRSQLPLFNQLGMSPLKVLEIGCGDGSIAKELSRLQVFQDYLGLEISPSGVEAANRMKILNAKFFCLGPEEIVSFKYQASVTLMCHVVEHLDNPRVLLLKAKEWSEYLIVEVPLEDNFGMSEDYDWNPVGHINKFKTSTIRHLIQTCGWEIVCTRMYNPSREARIFFVNSLKTNFIWLVKELAIRLNERIASRLFTYHYSVLARSKS